MDELTMGARIARSRKEKGLTQEALANALGVSNQAVSKWEGDVCCPDIQLLPPLCDTLGMTLDALFGREKKAEAAPANDQVLPVAAELPWAAILLPTACAAKARAISESGGKSAASFERRAFFLVKRRELCYYGLQ